METLQKNELFTLAMDLSLTDLTNLCKTSKKLNSRLCANEEFWKTKLGKDFPEWYLAKDTETIKNLGSFKNSYIFFHSIIAQNPIGFFSKISEKAKEIVERIRDITDTSKSSDTKRRKIYLSQREQNLYNLYNIIFDYILITLKKIAACSYELYSSDVEKYAPSRLGKRIEKTLNMEQYKNPWNNWNYELNLFIFNIYKTYLDLEAHREIDFGDNSC